MEGQVISTGHVSDAAVRITLVPVLLSILAVSGCVQHPLVPDSGFEGEWVGTVLDVPATVEFIAGGEVRLELGDLQEMNGTYELAEDESVALVSIIDSPDVEDDLGQGLQGLHAEASGDELTLYSHSPIANVYVDAAASASDVDSLVQAVEANPSVVEVVVVRPVGQPPIRLDIPLEPGSNTQDFQEWLAAQPAYERVNPGGTGMTFEGAVGSFRRAN